MQFLIGSWFRRTKITRSNNQELFQIWERLRLKWFPEVEHLKKYTINWSRRRQKRTLASCNLKDLHISVAKELDHIDHHRWLEPLIYHEMCHAVLGKNVSRGRRGRQWHGAEFKHLESQHPEISYLDTWIKSGGWMTAVRSHRTRSYHQTKHAI